ncbi:MAG: metallopeptidase TldD-related protein [Myxococcota bacterium]
MSALTVGLTGAILTGSVAGSVAYGADPFVDGIRAEMDRGKAELKLPDAEGPYHLAALAYDTHAVSITASLGGIVSRDERPGRRLGMVVRSGSTDLDNTNFDTYPNGIGAQDLVSEDHLLAIRHDSWLLCDRLYKQAVQARAAKVAAMARRATPDDVPDFAPGAPVTASAPAQPAYDADQLDLLARTLSGVFLAHPTIEWSQVYIDAEAGRRVMLDTGGVEVIEPVGELAVRVVARTRAVEGATQIDQRLWIVRSADALPPLEALVVETEALAAGLEAWRALPVLDEEYVGPVLVRDQAAIDLVRHLIAPSLIGTPPEEQPPVGSRVISFDSDGDGGPLQPHRRLLPAGWGIDDDPGRDPQRASAYAYDWEGQPAQAVTLVKDGIVQNHLMSRIPSDTFRASNGHARVGPGQLPRALAADLRVTAPSVATARKQHKAAIKLAAAYGLDHYVVVTRLRDPSVEWLDGGPLVSMRDFDDASTVPAPLEITRVFRDGRTERLRGAALDGLDLRSFKEVVLGGEVHTAAVESEAGSAFRGPNAGFPITFTVPDLLFDEVVVEPSPVDAEHPPRLPNPLAAR